MLEQKCTCDIRSARYGLHRAYEPDESSGHDEAVPDQPERQWDCDDPDEDYRECSSGLFEFEYLPQVVPKPANNLIAPPEAQNVHTSNSRCPKHSSVSVRSLKIKPCLSASPLYGIHQTIRKRLALSSFFPFFKIVTRAGGLGRRECGQQ